MDTLEQLRRQIAEIRIPPLPTPEEQAQIMRGRGKAGTPQQRQADLDAGRRAIQERVDAYNAAVTMRSQLTTQLADLEEKAGKRAGEEAAKSPEAQARKAAVSIVPSAIGYATGYGLGELEQRRQGRAQEGRNVNLRSAAELPTQAARMQAARRSGALPASNAFLRVGSRALPYAAGAAFFGADALIAHQMMNQQETEGARDIYGAGRNTLGGIAAGFAHSGVSATANPKVLPDAAAVGRIYAPDALAPSLPPPDAPEGPARRPNSERLISAARAGGAKGIATKAQAVAWLNENTTDANRGAIARELGVKGGPNVSKRITTAIKNMATSRTSSSIILPLAVGGLAYDAASTRAEASGATPGEARGEGARAAVTAGGATAATGYGINKLARAVPMAGKVLGGGLNALAGVAAAYDNASEAQGYRNAMPPEERDSPAGMLLPHAMPLAMRGASDIAAIASAPGRVRRAVSSALTPGNATPEETQGSLYPEAVPEPNALSRAGSISNNSPPLLMKAAALEIPNDIPPNAARDAEMEAAFGGGRFPEASGAPQGNALAQAGAVKDRFGQALEAFMAFVQQEQGGQQPADEDYLAR